jgi:hypothetical protein
VSFATLMSESENVLHGKKLVFLVGAPRSGTTWLQLLLSRSPSVATIGETRLFDLFMRSMLDRWNELRSASARESLARVVSDEEFRGLFRSVSGFAFAKIAQSKPSATVVLEKTPGHVFCSREILDLWPDANFIHIIRDPRSVVASLRTASKSFAPEWRSSGISTICERAWARYVASGRQISSATPNYQEVSYEELISNGPEVLMRLLRGLGVYSSLGECQRHVEDCRIENLRAGELSNAPFDVARVAKDNFFRIGTTDSWRVELSNREIAIIERTAGTLMSELGYERATRSKLMSILVDLGWSAGAAARAAKRRVRGFVARRGPVPV